MRYAIILLLSTLIPCQAMAIHPALARMNRAAGDGSNFSGSCVLIAKSDTEPSVALWATAAHVIQQGVGLPWVQVPRGYIYQASKVVAFHPVEDFAVVATSAKGLQAKPVPIAESPQGGAIHEGFGGGQWRTSRGEFVRYWSSTGSGTRDVGNWTTSSISGDSGGPIFNTQGQLVGIITGAGGPRDTMGPHCGLIRRVLRGVTFPLRMLDGAYHRVQARCQGPYCQIVPVQPPAAAPPAYDDDGQGAPVAPVPEPTPAPLTTQPLTTHHSPSGACNCCPCNKTQPDASGQLKKKLPSRSSKVAGKKLFSILKKPSPACGRGCRPLKAK